MFANCEQLKTVVVHDEMEMIGENAFSNCISLQDIQFPKNLKTIGNYAFMNCNSLTSIDFPETIKTIGDDAFSSCSSLEYIKMFAPTPPFLESYGVFQDTNECPIYVNNNSLDLYLADDKWIEYYDRIVGVDLKQQLGDVNGDGIINISDVVTLTNYILGNPQRSSNPFLGDMDHSGEINITDAIRLLNEILNQ